MKKLALLLSLILSFSILISCSNTDKVEGNEDVVVVEEPVYKDMNGAEFRFMSQTPVDYYPEIGASESGDKIIKRYADVNEMFNCNFIVDMIDSTSSSALATFTTRVAAMTEDVPDLIDIHGREAYPFYEQGVLYPVNSISTIDLTQTCWGTPNFLQYGMFDNVNNYGIFPYDWNTMPQFAGMILVNNELLKLLSTKNPYAMMENGEWTWDNFLALVKECTVKDGEKQIFGLGIQDVNYHNRTVLFSNGVSPVIKQNEEFVFGYNTPEAFAAMDYNAKFYTDKLVKDGNYDIFVNGDCVFYSCESWAGTEQRENYPAFELNDYGFLPFPSGSNVEYGTTSAFVHMGRRLNWFVDKASTDKEDLGTVLTAVFAPLDGTQPENWKIVSKDILFHHTEDYNNFMKMMDNMNYDYSCQLSKVNDRINSAIAPAMKGTKTPAEALGAATEQINTAIKESFTSSTITE